MFKWFKDIIILFLYKIIELIERIEFRNIDLDENDISKKLIYSQSLENIKVMSDSGWVDVSHFHQTQPYKVWNIKLDNGYELDCADNHIIFTSDLEKVFVKDIKLGDEVFTDIGPSKVVSIFKSKKKVSMGDLTIDTNEHRYFTNGILSHNTISAAITILHFILFNNDKGVMIIANKGDTVVEIIDKVKSIYTLLPFFLQKGVKVWNQKSLTLENGSKIKSQARSKTPAIGFTIDLLYLDEFAHIPSNIIGPYYTAAYPTVSAVQNSKIIITSTPNGMNLFHTLLTNAEREDDDPLKSNYKAMRVYWNQVPGRNVTYLRMYESKMKEHKVNRHILWEECCKRWMPNGDEVDSNNLPICKQWYDDENGRWVISVQNYDCESEDVKSLFIENEDGKEVPVMAFCNVSTWKEDTIKDLGGGKEGEESFNQEYGLKFIAGAKSLFDEKVIDRLLSKKREFKYRDIDVLDDRLTWDYKGLKWIDDDSIFNHADRKKIRGIISIDVSEGLGQDYSVINIFQLVKKSKEEIERTKDKLTTFDEFFKLQQIGIYRNNITSVGQLAEIAYLLAFEYFDEDRFKIVLEVNNHGHAFLEAIPNVFDQNNNYGSFIFMRFKHRIDATRKSIGLKVGKNKNLFVKEYQDRMRRFDIEVFEQNTIKEITTFVKHETSAGNITYKADIGQDDCVMTLVNMSNVFKDVTYKDLVDEHFQEMGDPQFENYMNDILNSKEYVEGTDYGSFIEIKKRQTSLNKTRSTINNHISRGGNWTNQI